ncbi:hypothetical protein AJ80_10060 [Polytolypa hystricis UAMH7299]|uniref:Uncharacterized protein n=1 Tax=Polytolypa hystricis (strain UAMH7299) TaxID=1447883 RepID=A0A2B7WEH9_POLH7|nr:hypothetical protein AJ80_10060 [Polytolypa hystricis UAMH7299]
MEVAHTEDPRFISELFPPADWLPVRDQFDNGREFCEQVPTLRGTYTYRFFFLPDFDALRAMTVPRFRSLRWRRDAGDDIQVPTRFHLLGAFACYVYATGHIRNGSPCSLCVSGEGPFRYYVVPRTRDNNWTLFGGYCANCLWTHGGECSHVRSPGPVHSHFRNPSLTTGVLPPIVSRPREHLFSDDSSPCRSPTLLLEDPVEIVDLLSSDSIEMPEEPVVASTTEAVSDLAGRPYSPVSGEQFLLARSIPET